MTFRQVLRAVARRWYVLVVAMICAGLVLAGVARNEGVYFARYDLVFLPPASATDDQNTLGSIPDSMVEFAGIVERQYNGNTATRLFASDDATLYGAGVTRGTQVFLPKSGGQWTGTHKDPMLIVEAVDSSEARVLDSIERVIDDVQEIAQQRQDAANVDPENYISMLVSDRTSRVAFVTGSKNRGIAGIVALGLGVGVAGAAILDQLLARRRRHHPPVVVPAIG